MTAHTTFPRYRGAIWTLLVLAPFVSEVLSGSTRLSILFVLLPEMMVWGGGALLARDLVRRWKAGMTSLLLLGLAMSVAEEFIIQQTSIAPLPFAGVNAVYGRYAGVNWIYFLFMLGFESVWVVLTPVTLTELLFPAHGEKPWLRLRGACVTGVCFVLGSFLAWFGWTQQARPRLGAAPYSPPVALLAAGVLAIGALIALAWLLRGVGLRASRRKATGPWVGGATAFVFSGPWWMLLTLLFVPGKYPAAGWIAAAGLLWAAAAYFVLRFLAETEGWGTLHRWACCCGCVLSCCVFTDLSSAGWTRADLLAKYGFQGLALAGLAWLGMRLRTAARAA